MTIQADFTERATPWSDIQGHMAFLRGAVSKPGCVVIELGVRSGNSTVSFLAGLPDDGELWSCDISPPEVPQEWHSDERWHFFQGDDMNPEIQAAMPAGCDVFFLDTSHEFQHTLAELRAFVPRVRPGGMVLCHDTQFFPPGQDCGEPRGEVAQALNTYCAETGLTWSNRPGYYGLGVIEIPALVSA